MRTAYGRPVPDEAVSRGADELVEAVTDAARLVPWAQPNAAVLQSAPTLNPYRPSMLDLCLSALAGPGPEDATSPQPLLRFVSPDVRAMPLLDVVVTGKRTSTLRCEWCNSKTPRSWKHRLLVPMGASVVAIHLCSFCRDIMNEHYPHLVWG